jgi:hypothetical protein
MKVDNSDDSEYSSELLENQNKENEDEKENGTNPNQAEKSESEPSFANCLFK